MKRTSSELCNFIPYEGNCYVDPQGNDLAHRMLPEEIIDHIFSFLTTDRDFCRANSVSHFWESRTIIVKCNVFQDLKNFSKFIIKNLDDSHLSQKQGFSEIISNIEKLPGNSSLSKAITEEVSLKTEVLHTLEDVGGDLLNSIIEQQYTYEKPKSNFWDHILILAKTFKGLSTYREHNECSSIMSLMLLDISQDLEKAIDTNAVLPLRSKPVKNFLWRDTPREGLETNRAVSDVLTRLAHELSRSRHTYPKAYMNLAYGKFTKPGIPNYEIAKAIERLIKKGTIGHVQNTMFCNVAIQLAASGDLYTSLKFCKRIDSSEEYESALEAISTFLAETGYYNDTIMYFAEKILDDAKRNSVFKKIINSHLDQEDLESALFIINLIDVTERCSSLENISIELVKRGRIDEALEMAAKILNDAIRASTYAMIFASTQAVIQ